MLNIVDTRIRVHFDSNEFPIAHSKENFVYKFDIDTLIFVASFFPIFDCEFARVQCNRSVYQTIENIDYLNNEKQVLNNELQWKKRRALETWRFRHFLFRLVLLNFLCKINEPFDVKGIVQIWQINEKFFSLADDFSFSSIKLECSNKWSSKFRSFSKFSSHTGHSFVIRIESSKDSFVFSLWDTESTPLKSMGTTGDANKRSNVVDEFAVIKSDVEEVSSRIGSKFFRIEHSARRKPWQIERCWRKSFKSVKRRLHLPQINKSSISLVTNGNKNKFETFLSLNFDSIYFAVR